MMDDTEMDDGFEDFDFENYTIPQDEFTEDDAFKAAKQTTELSSLNLYNERHKILTEMTSEERIALRSGPINFESLKDFDRGIWLGATQHQVLSMLNTILNNAVWEINDMGIGKQRIDNNVKIVQKVTSNKAAVAQLVTSYIKATQVDKFADGKRYSTIGVKKLHPDIPTSPYALKNADVSLTGVVAKNYMHKYAEVIEASLNTEVDSLMPAIYLSKGIVDLGIKPAIPKIMLSVKDTGRAQISSLTSVFGSSCWYEAMPVTVPETLNTLIRLNRLDSFSGNIPPRIGAYFQSTETINIVGSTFATPAAVKTVDKITTGLYFITQRTEIVETIPTLHYVTFLTDANFVMAAVVALSCTHFPSLILCKRPYLFWTPINHNISGQVALLVRSIIQQLSMFIYVNWRKALAGDWQDWRFDFKAVIKSDKIMGFLVKATTVEYLKVQRYQVPQGVTASLLSAFNKLIPVDASRVAAYSNQDTGATYAACSPTYQSDDLPDAKKKFVPAMNGAVITAQQIIDRIWIGPSSGCLNAPFLEWVPQEFSDEDEHYLSTLTGNFSEEVENTMYGQNKEEFYFRFEQGKARAFFYWLNIQVENPNACLTKLTQ